MKTDFKEDEQLKKVLDFAKTGDNGLKFMSLAYLMGQEEAKRKKDGNENNKAS